MASVFAQYGFVQVIFIAALVAIVLQCLVYPIRRWFGLRAAQIVLHGSLVAFLLVSIESVVAASLSGSLAEAVNRGGLAPVTDFALFIVLAMFISYFMGARYLADERERAERLVRQDAEAGERDGARVDDADPQGVADA